MSAFVDRLLERPGDAVVLVDDAGALTADGLHAEVESFADSLRERKIAVLATLLDNGRAWICADLAAMRAGVVHVPLAGFQSPGQWRHILATTGADALLAPALPFDWPADPIAIAGQPLLLARQAAASRVPAGIAKVSFTSGSTGTPRGVCLAEATMRHVAEGVAEALAPLAIERHQCALPLPVLLENVSGLYAPLLAGARCGAHGCAALGLRGATGFDPAALHGVVDAGGAQSLILLPQMLRAWTGWLQASHRRGPPGLRFVAVGGAPVGAANLLRARAAGLPAYEGYGLTEGGSVQTLNLPGADAPGSAGRPLPHCRLSLRDDGEIEIAGALAQGYLADSATAFAPPFATGDLGSIDEAGHLWIDGRRKHVFITGFGRNVSPEWVESVLQCEGAIAQAVVFGEGLPAPVAVLWPVADALPDEALEAAVTRANDGLPDYARIGAWARGRRPFDAASGMATENGRPRRDAIAEAHARLLATGRLAT